MVWGVHRLWALLLSPFVIFIITHESSSATSTTKRLEQPPFPKWIANIPNNFTVNLHDQGKLLDVRDDPTSLLSFTSAVKSMLRKATGPLRLATDGEAVDAVERYFWGQKRGLAIEMGAVDGLLHSQTYDLEQLLGWRRVLVEGNPLRRNALIQNAPMAYSVNGAVCEHETKVHYIHTQKNYTAGIAEFMSSEFLHKFHPLVYQAGSPPGDVSTVDWKRIPSADEIDCIPLSKVLAQMSIRHVNFFVLDVEGGELAVLKSIDWAQTAFDVLCIETDPPFRPPDYAQDVSDFMEEKGYINHSGQMGRNIWFIHKDFKPFQHPNTVVNPECWNGYLRFSHSNAKNDVK